MIRRSLAILTVVLSVSVLPSAQAASARTYVAVTDSRGLPVTGLSPMDFAVRVDGVERQVTGARPRHSTGRPRTFSSGERQRRCWSASPLPPVS
jgi:hypothetical protein